MISRAQPMLLHWWGLYNRVPCIFFPQQISTKQSGGEVTMAGKVWDWVAPLLAKSRISGLLSTWSCSGWFTRWRWTWGCRLEETLALWARRIARRSSSFNSIPHHAVVGLLHNVTADERPPNTSAIPYSMPRAVRSVKWGTAAQGHRASAWLPPWKPTAPPSWVVGCVEDWSHS